MQTVQSALSKIPAIGIAFQPKSHAYTMYRTDGKNGVYIESNTLGDERACSYFFDANWEIEDSEGESFSDAFESAAIAAVQAL